MHQGSGKLQSLTCQLVATDVKIYGTRRHDQKPLPNAQALKPLAD